MINSSICCSDSFLSLPHSSQVLYIQYCLNADNEGFISNPKTIMRNVSCTYKDIDTLIENGFIYYFSSGVCVVTHWLIHNTLKNDRNYQTSHKAERNCLDLDQSKKYVIKIDIDVNITFYFPNGFQVDSKRIPSGSANHCITYQGSSDHGSSDHFSTNKDESAREDEDNTKDEYDTLGDIKKAVEESKKNYWDTEQDEYF